MLRETAVIVIIGVVTRNTLLYKKPPWLVATKLPLTPLCLVLGEYEVRIPSRLQIPFTGVY